MDSWFGSCWLLLVVVGCFWLLLVVVGCCWLLLVVVGCCWSWWLLLWLLWLLWWWFFFSFSFSVSFSCYFSFSFAFCFLLFAFFCFFVFAICFCDLFIGSVLSLFGCLTFQNDIMQLFSSFHCSGNITGKPFPPGTGRQLTGKANDQHSSSHPGTRQNLAGPPDSQHELLEIGAASAGCEIQRALCRDRDKPWKKYALVFTRQSLSEINLVSSFLLKVVPGEAFVCFCNS